MSEILQSSFDEVILRLQDFTRQRRLRWESLFRDFDRHNNKHVTEHVFIRGLKSSKAVLTEEEISFLVNQFRSREGVNYEWFCDRVNKVFTEKGLERSPRRQVRDVLPRNTNLHYHSKGNGLSVESNCKLSLFMERISRKVRTESIVLKTFFMDYDHHNSGFITPQQFKRGLKILFLNRESDVEEMADALTFAYADDGGSMNYRRFTDDINALVETHRSTGVVQNGNVSLSGSCSEDLDSLSGICGVEDVIEQMKNVVRTEGVDPLRFFADLDSMKKGTISRAQFKSALSTAFLKRIFLRQDLLENLADRYSCSTRIHDGASLDHEFVVRYNDYVDEVDPFSVERRSLHTRPGQRFELMSNTIGDTSMPDFGAPIALDNIRTFAQTRRMHLKPVFQDFDRLHRGFITAHQFARVLKQELYILGLSETDILELNEYFRHSTGFGTDYVRFIKALDVSHNSKRSRASRSDLGLPTSPPPPTESESIDRDAIVERVQREMRRLRIRFSEFFSDADKQNYGLITMSQLLRGLSRARLNLTEEEVFTLAEPYSVQRSVEASKYQIPLRWRDLVRELEMVEVISGLERAPSLDVRVKTLADLPIGSQTGEEVDREVEELLERMEQNVRTDRAFILPAFKIHDKLNSGKLEQTLFRRVLDTLNLKSLKGVSEEVLDGLCCRFSLGQGSLGHVVDYRKFIQRVDISYAPKIIPTNDSVDKPFALETLDNQSESECQSDFERATSIIDNISDQAWGKGLRLKQFLEDYDRLRKGIIPKSKFESALNMCGLSINHEDIAFLSSYFVALNEPQMVSYVPLMHLIDGGNEKLEAFPTQQVHNRAPRSFEERHVRQISLQTVESILEPMKTAVRLRNLNLYDAFKSYDRKNLKAVTLTQFTAVLKTFGILPKEKVQESIEKLHMAFPSQYGEKINYASFVREVGF